MKEREFRGIRAGILFDKSREIQMLRSLRRWLDRGSRGPLPSRGLQSFSNKRNKEILNPILACYFLHMGKTSAFIQSSPLFLRAFFVQPGMTRSIRMIRQQQGQQGWQNSRLVSLARYVVQLHRCCWYCSPDECSINARHNNIMKHA
jgi:hypothetical protein